MHKRLEIARYVGSYGVNRQAKLMLPAAHHLINQVKFSESTTRLCRFKWSPYGRLL